MVEELARDRPRDLDLLLEVTAGAYYMCAEVRHKIGYPGQETLVLPRTGFGGEKLLDPMLRRAPSFRDPRPIGMRAQRTEGEG
jgi:hypothetical protein